MKHRRFRISDHAIIRYLERVQGVDVDAIRREIHETVAPALDHEGVSAVILGGFRYHLENGVLKSITHANQPGHAGKWRRK